MSPGLQKPLNRGLTSPMATPCSWVNTLYLYYHEKCPLPWCHHLRYFLKGNLVPTTFPIQNDRGAVTVIWDLRVLDIPISKTLVIWASPLTLTLTTNHEAKMKRGCPYHLGFGNGDAHITVTVPHPFSNGNVLERKVP